MADKKEKKRGLGRGLSALMADVGPENQVAEPGAPRTADRRIPIENIKPNPDQPRRRFAEEDLRDLTASVKEKGVIQPLIVRPKGKDQFEIVAGERRWRAAQAANLHDLPVVVRDLNDTEVLEIAIIENIQRADLNPIEEAAGYKQLMDKFGHTQEKLSEALGKSRSHIANLMRLLNLPEDVLGFVQEGKISAGHARALLMAEAPLAMAKRAIAERWSVRKTEEMVRVEGQGGPTKQKGGGTKAQTKDADTLALEGDLSAALGMKVSIEHKGSGESGQLTVKYANLEALDRLCGLLSS
jgi:ParB family chromosome partitioning protein